MVRASGVRGTVAERRAAQGEENADRNAEGASVQDTFGETAGAARKRASIRNKGSIIYLINLCLTS